MARGRVSVDFVSADSAAAVFIFAFGCKGDGRNKSNSSERNQLVLCLRPEWHCPFDDFVDFLIMI